LDSEYVEIFREKIKTYKTFTPMPSITDKELVCELSKEELEYIKEVGENTSLALLNINNPDSFKRNVAKLKIKYSPKKYVILDHDLQLLYDTKKGYRYSWNTDLIAEANKLL